jgi:NAD(P)-dependent dehydrogenase (short-subunit alcohol dehydrogenase family)
LSTGTRSSIVTGSSKGIGAAVVERLANDGFAVIINYSSGAAPALELAANIKRAGGKAIAVQADISHLADVRGLFDAAESAFGGVDVLVNTDLFTNGTTQADIRPIIDRTPLGRLGEPGDIANVISFLAGPDGGWINGQVLRANGGTI